MTGLPKRASNREQNSDRTRASILDAVRKLIEETESVEFSLARVAQVSGKNAALVSYHFGGKEQMLLAVLRDDEAKIMNPVTELSNWDHLDAKEKLRLHIRGVFKLFAKKPYLSLLTRTLVRRSDEKTARELVTDAARPVIQLQKQILDQGVKEGAFRPVDPFSFYMITMGAVEFFFAGSATIKYGFKRNPSDRKLLDDYSNTVCEAALRVLAN